MVVRGICVLAILSGIYFFTGTGCKKSYRVGTHAHLFQTVCMMKWRHFGSVSVFGQAARTGWRKRPARSAAILTVSAEAAING